MRRRVSRLSVRVRRLRVRGRVRRSRRLISRVSWLGLIVRRSRWRRWRSIGRLRRRRRGRRSIRARARARVCLAPSTSIFTTLNDSGESWGGERQKSNACFDHFDF
jgi:hypothetical protein